MNEIRIPEDILISMLEKAFEEGYFGYLDAKKDRVKLLMDSHIKNKLEIRASQTPAICDIYNQNVLLANNFTYNITTNDL